MPSSGFFREICLTKYLLTKYVLTLFVCRLEFYGGVVLVCCCFGKIDAPDARVVPSSVFRISHPTSVRYPTSIRRLKKYPSEEAESRRKGFFCIVQVELSVFPIPPTALPSVTFVILCLFPNCSFQCNAISSYFPSTFLFSADSCTFSILLLC